MLEHVSGVTTQQTQFKALLFIALLCFGVATGFGYSALRAVAHADYEAHAAVAKRAALGGVLFFVAYLVARPNVVRISSPSATIEFSVRLFKRSTLASELADLLESAKDRRFLSARSSLP